MIVYEVNIQVQNESADDYRAWLGDHVRELLTLPGFLSAEVLIAPTSLELPGVEEIVVLYRLESQHALMIYLADYAPAMRAKMQANFGGKFTIARRVLSPLVEMVRTDVPAPGAPAAE